ncbi:MAG: tetratricopeptide repeat protein, partial [Wenzhouxiangella sp.]|nr:tetratricopeptide repeat protein [Wenzhouxiangella sp.]
MSKGSSLFTELKRRNVFRVGLFYIVSAWLVIQVAETILPIFDVPGVALRAVVLILVLGFPPALIFAWIFELTPEGLKLDKNAQTNPSAKSQIADKLNVATLVVAILAIGLLAFDRLVPEPERIRAAGTVPTIESRPGFEAATTSNLSAGDDVIGTQPESISRQSVAVLPFTTRSSDPEDAFFTDGMHDDLLTQLAKIAALKVISRTSVMEYQDTTKKLPEIARELGVAAVVEGGVQRAGNRVRINAQLIEADTDLHLWAETYDRELSAENIFEIQTEIVRSIALALEATLTSSEEEQLSQILTDNLAAWEAYRRGLHLLNGITAVEAQQAAAEARRAIDLDPQFAAAYGLLARAHMTDFWFFGADPADRTAAGRAIAAGREIDADSPQLDTAEAYFHYWGFLDYDRALAAVDRALLAIPNDAELYKVRGYALRRAGRFAETIEAFERAHVLDPRSSVAAQALMETHIALGRFEAARRWEAIASEIDPGSATLAVLRAELALDADADLESAMPALIAAGTSNTYADWLTWHTYLSAGRFEEALESADFGDAAESALVVYPPKMLLGITHRIAGNPDEAEQFLTQARAELATQLAANPDDHKLLRAQCQATGALGEREAARRYCEQALNTAVIDAFDINWTRLNVAQALAMADDIEGAFEVLE